MHGWRRIIVLTFLVLLVQGAKWNLHNTGSDNRHVYASHSMFYFVTYDCAENGNPSSQ
jgi:hypothetical protein